jgi:hypothetical protein
VQFDILSGYNPLPAKGSQKDKDGDSTGDGEQKVATEHVTTHKVAKVPTPGVAK